MSFPSLDWQLCFINLKISQQKSKQVFHPSLPSDVQNVLGNLPKINPNDLESFEKKLAAHYFLFFSPRNKETLSKMRYVMKYSYLLPLSDTTIQFTDSLIMLVLELQNYANKLAHSSSIVYNPSKVTDSMKAAFKAQKKAASIYKYITLLLAQIDRRTIEAGSEAPLFELTEEYNKMMQEIHWAQGQEIGIFLTLDKEKKFAMLGKLGRNVFEIYRDMYSKFNNYCPDSKGISTPMKAVRGYLTNKMILYDAFTHLQNALQFNEDADNGNAMYLMRDAKGLIQKLKKVQKKFTSNHWDKESIKNYNQLSKTIAELVERYSNQIERENNTIYHATIPDAGPSLLDAQGIGSIEDWELQVPENLEGMATMYDNVFTGANEGSMSVPGQMPSSPIIEDVAEENEEPPSTGDLKQPAEMKVNPEAPKSKSCTIL